MPVLNPSTLAAWQLFTRLGEMQLLLPVAALLALLLLRQPGQRALAGQWLLRLTAAALLTTISKLAFIGWGIGSALLDFTGVSGHAMFACAIHPVLFGALVAAVWPGTWRIGAVAGMALGVAVAVSRVVVDAHSVSEAVAGVLLGGWAGVLALRMHSPRLGPMHGLAVALALWLVATPLVAPGSQSHALVTSLALALSGKQQPYTREMLRTSGQPDRRAALGGGT